MNITVRFEGGYTSSILEVVVWHGRLCGRKRRDFRMVTLDHPWRCGIADGGEWLNVQSVFTPIKELEPIIDNETFAIYEVNPPHIPD